MSLLEVDKLTVSYRTAKGLLKAVDEVSFQLDEGQSLGLVGESGCGKTTIGMALMRLLADNGRISGGSIRFNGRDLAALSEEEMRSVRWREMAMIFQAAMNALNPVQRVGDQLAEALLAHRDDLSKEQAMHKVEGLYQMVGLSPARMADYPHQYSGGMRQRAIIAMALALNPKLIIADEPTTALDVIVQDQILKEIKNLQRDLGISVVFISHDISIVAEVCDRIGVMYAGQLVEMGTTEEVFFNSQHPYTRALVSSFPTLSGPLEKLSPIPGEPPNLVGTIPGCRFCSRCPNNEASCKLEHPRWARRSQTHYVLCDSCEDTYKPAAG